MAQYGVTPAPQSLPDQARQGHSPYYPMEVLNGLVVPNPRRQPPSCDMDETGRLFRRFVNTGLQDVQLANGLRNRIGRGWRGGYNGTPILFGMVPINPGPQMTYAGFHKKGPSPYNITDMYQNGPGSQPAHPGGPGKIAGDFIDNPMTG